MDMPEKQLSCGGGVPVIGEEFDDDDDDPDYELHLALVEEAGLFQEVEKHECWRCGMMEEMGSIEANNTLRLVDLPPGHRSIGLKSVYYVKEDADGVVVKYKDRIIAKEYVQKHDVDYDEVFALVARVESVGLLALTARIG